MPSNIYFPSLFSGNFASYNNVTEAIFFFVAFFRFSTFIFRRNVLKYLVSAKKKTHKTSLGQRLLFAVNIYYVSLFDGVNRKYEKHVGLVSAELACVRSFQFS